MWSNFLWKLFRSGTFSSLCLFLYSLFVFFFLSFFLSLSLSLSLLSLFSSLLFSSLLFSSSLLFLSRRMIIPWIDFPSFFVVRECSASEVVKIVLSRRHRWWKSKGRGEWSLEKTNEERATESERERAREREREERGERRERTLGQKRNGCSDKRPSILHRLFPIYMLCVSSSHLYSLFYSLFYHLFYHLFYLLYSPPYPLSSFFSAFFPQHAYLFIYFWKEWQTYGKKLFDRISQGAL